MELKGLKLSDARRLQNKLELCEHLSVVYAAILTDNILNRFDSRVREGALLWLDDKLTDEFGVENTSIGYIRKMTGMSQLEALCFLDIYLKNEDFAKHEVTWFRKRYD